MELDTMDDYTVPAAAYGPGDVIVTADDEQAWHIVREAQIVGDTVLYVTVTGATVYASQIDMPATDRLLPDAGTRWGWHCVGSWERFTGGRTDLADAIDRELVESQRRGRPVDVRNLPAA